MFKPLFFCFSLFSLLVLPSVQAVELEVDRVKTLFNAVDYLWRGESSYAVTTMYVKTANYARTMKMEGWSKGKEKTLFRVVKPLREKGTSTLK